MSEQTKEKVSVGGKVSIVDVGGAGGAQEIPFKDGMTLNDALKTAGISPAGKDVAVNAMDIQPADYDKYQLQEDALIVISGEVQNG